MAPVDDVTLGDIVTDNAVRFPDVVAYRHGHRSRHPRPVTGPGSAFGVGDGRGRGEAPGSHRGVEPQQHRVRRAERGYSTQRNHHGHHQLPALGAGDGQMRCAGSPRRSCSAPSEFIPVISRLVAGMLSPPLVVAIGGETCAGDHRLRAIHRRRPRRRARVRGPTRRHRVPAVHQRHDRRVQVLHPRSAGDAPGRVHDERRDALRQRRSRADQHADVPFRCARDRRRTACSRRNRGAAATVRCGATRCG